MECTACGHRIAHRKWKETNLHPGTAGQGNMLGSCLVSSHFLWAILCPQAVGCVMPTKKFYSRIYIQRHNHLSQFGLITLFQFDLLEFEMGVILALELKWN